MNIKDVLEFTYKLSILFVEDDPYIREQTKEILESIFKTVYIAENGEDALNLYKDNFNNTLEPIDIVLSDIHMPKMDGIELTEAIYKLNPSQVVLILSAYNDTKFLIKLINLGVEQFIQKPIYSDQLILNILDAAKKVIQQKELQNDQKIVISNNFSYDKESKTIQCHGESVELTKFEIIFIELLTENTGQVYTNENIVSYYKSLNHSIDPTNIRKLVSKLRKKLPRNYINSVYGVGYKLTQESA